MLGAFCLTEPHVGSQAGGLRTTAVRDGDDYVLDGVKQFITSGKNGDVAIVMAVTDRAACKRGISAFVVPTAYRLGDEGQGLKIALSGLEGGRIAIASQCVGMARAAFVAAPVDLACGDAEGCRPAVPEGSGDGQAQRQRDG